MGFATDLHCAACGYAVDFMVHGRSFGEAGPVQAVACADCRALRVARLPEPPASPEPLRCPESAAHRVVPWSHPGPCPRCGAELRAGERFVIWD